MFRQAGVIQVDTLEDMFDVAQLLAHQPLPRGRRVAIVGNSDALGLLAADAAAAVGLVVNKSVALGAEPSAEDFEDALDAAIDDPEVDAVVAVYIPPLNVSGEDIANVLAAVGEQSDKPLVSTFLGAEGVPGAAAGARRRRVDRRPRLGAVLPRRRVGGAGPGPGRRVRRVAAHPRRSSRPSRTGSTPPGAKAAGRAAAAASTPRGSTSARRTSPSCWPAYRHRPVGPAARSPPSRRPGRPPRRWAGTWCSRRPPRHLRERPDQAHVFRNIDDAEAMEDAWETLAALVARSPRSRASWCRRARPPGVPVGDPQHRGPAVRPRGLLRHLRAADRPARRPLLPDPAAGGARRRVDGARDQGGADAVRLPRRRGGRRRRGRAADPAGRAAAERPAAGQLAGAVAGAGRARRVPRCSAPAPGSSPVADPRSDASPCRRMPSLPGDTGCPADADLGPRPGSSSCTCRRPGDRRSTRP